MENKRLVERLCMRAPGLFLLAVASLGLAACSKVRDEQVASDVSRIFPGCKVKDIGSPKNSTDAGNSDIYIKVSYVCEGSPVPTKTYLQYKNATSTGFTSYCCAEEVPYFLRVQRKD